MPGSADPSIARTCESPSRRPPDVVASPVLGRSRAGTRPYNAEPNPHADPSWRSPRRGRRPHARAPRPRRGGTPGTGAAGRGGIVRRGPEVVPLRDWTGYSAWVQVEGDGWSPSESGSGVASP